MKKLLLVLGIMMMATSLTYAVDEETTSEDEGTVAESTAATSAEAPAPVAATLSKGDSFMAAFGMETSAVSGGEAGGITSSAGSTAVAHTSAHVGAVSLTSSQNTPYSYK